MTSHGDTYITHNRCPKLKIYVSESLQYTEVRFATLQRKAGTVSFLFLSFSIYLCRASCNCVFMTCSTSYCLFDLLMDPRNVRIYIYIYVCVCVCVCVMHVHTTSLTDFTVSTTHGTKNFQTTFDFCIILFVSRTVTIITHTYIKKTPQNVYKIKNHPYT